MLPRLPVSLAAALLALAAAACDSPATSTATATAPAGPEPFVAPDAPADPKAAAARLASAGTQPDSLHLLSPGRAGRLALGMSEKSLLARVPAAQLTKTTHVYKGVTYPAYLMTDAQQPTAPPSRLELVGSAATGYTLRRIRITDPQYRTGEGIGVGSPFGAARQVYGLTRVRSSEGDFVAISSQQRMGWILDENSLPADHSADMPSSAIPPATRIVGVFLVK
ncbi:hypothetical protein [Hymenobacter persicinus]|uniref:Uncharacterized protein n=1 Tax=Hymenobacter persicinus TaxID=2025506 RepID=A0A4Q5LEH7_9BACT|nr:hypothetical protein [Hymenobacter persicinus]RYU80520.1 hypothetical protein EWM57_08485 [Hymenobacter persicinus]